MNPRPFSILTVSADRTTLRRLAKFLDVFGYGVCQATDAVQAIAAAEATRPDFLIVDGSGAHPADLGLCRSIRQIWPQGYTYALLLVERPEMGDITAGLEQGYDDFLSAPIVFGELLARLRAGARVIEFERRWAEHAGVNPATGLADQAALAGELHRRSQSAKGSIGWLAVFELDYSRRFSDRLGRSAADELVRQVSQHLRERCGSDYFIASLEQDHIAVVLPASGADAAQTWCDGALQALAESSFTITEKQHRVTASCGLTEVAAGEVLEVIQARVRRAVQLAKSSGGNCIVTSGEVDRDADQWAAFAADGKLFHTTVARDVMHPCPLLLHIDESLEQAHALLAQTGLAYAPVVDAEGKLVGLVSLDQLAAAKLRSPKPRGQHSGNSSSVRLVRHVMTSDVTRFDETAPLAELMEYFTGDSSTLAIIVRDKCPRGLVHCHALAALNERLTADHFASSKPHSGTSEDLLVPDLAMAE